MDERFYPRLFKLMKECDVSNNDLYQIISYLNRRYLTNLVRDNIVHLFDNSIKPTPETIKFVDDNGRIPERED